ncbi:hypothetical protein R4I97_08480 [Brachyspira pilosicoli]|uniref:hypothetical protein n=1 Tax=Brachyspira pilosicoli TaxID=52584 RepID=UPI0030064F84
MNKKELYYEFDEKILFEHLHLFYTDYDYVNGRFSDKKRFNDWEEGFKILKDKYINNELSLGNFLQIINQVLKILWIYFTDFYNANIHDYFKLLLTELLDLKKYKDEKKEQIDANIYELILYCSVLLSDVKCTLSIANEALKIYPNNKKYLLDCNIQGVHIDKSIDIIDNQIKYHKNDDMEIIRLVPPIIIYLKNKDINKYYDKIKEYFNFLINAMKPYENYFYYLKSIYSEDEIMYAYIWKYEFYLNPESNLIAYYSLYHKTFDENIEDKIKSHEKIINMNGDLYSKKDIILDLSYYYMEAGRYNDSYKLLEKYRENAYFKYDVNYKVLFGKAIYKRDENNEVNYKLACEYFRAAIDRINYYDDKEYAIVHILSAIKDVKEMEKKGHAPLGYSKFLLRHLYYSQKEDIYFQYMETYKFAYDEIEDYSICADIILDIKKSEIYNKVILADKEKFEQYNFEFSKYMINSIHNLNTDNINELNKIFEEEDFFVYKNILIDLINKRAETELLNYNIEILNKEVLIELYRIMSILRKDILIRELFDFVESSEDCLNEVNKWKNTKLEKVNHLEKEYTLCYHYRSYQINKKMPDNYVAISQIRNTLTHRINENKGVENFIKHKKDAINFIDMHFQSIVKCLFDIIINHNILSLEHFRSEEFLGK